MIVVWFFRRFTKGRRYQDRIYVINGNKKPVFGAEIFRLCEACDEEQGSVVNLRDRRDEEHNEAEAEKIKPKKVSWGYMVK